MWPLAGLTFTAGAALLGVGIYKDRHWLEIARDMPNYDVMRHDGAKAHPRAYKLRASGLALLGISAIAGAAGALTR